MTKLALVGGSEIAKYSVADVMWGYIAEVSGTELDFEVIPLADSHEVQDFYNQYLSDDTFIGFNVALPWKQVFAGYVEKDKSSDHDSGIINTVYKSGNQIRGINTDVLGVARGLLRYDLRGKKALLLGAGGAGKSAALYLQSQLGVDVYTFDIANYPEKADNSRLSSLAELRAQTYDVIINATPLGKFYLDQPIMAFSSPIDVATLRLINHSNTILQEMNYLPIDTLFLQLGDLLGLNVVAGVEMLVYQAAESFERYFGSALSPEQTDAVIEKMRQYIRSQESAILKHEY